jgi:hypothetical protein
MGTRSRLNSAPIATIVPARRSTGARHGATVPNTSLVESTIAHRSNRTGGLRSRSGPGRLTSLDRSKGCYLLQGLRPDPRYLLELFYRAELSVGLPVLDYALGRRRPDLGQRVEFVYVRGVYVYPERVLRFILYLFQGDGVDDPRRSFREARGLEGATCQHDHDQHRHDYLRPVTREGAGPMSSPRTWTTRSRLERSVSHRTGYQDTRVEALARFARQTAASQHLS